MKDSKTMNVDAKLLELRLKREKMENAYMKREHRNAVAMQKCECARNNLWILKELGFGKNDMQVMTQLRMLDQVKDIK